MAAVSYSTIAQPNPGGVLFIEVPARVVAALGEKKRIPVNATINGVSYRSTIAVYGGKFYLPARKEIREAADRKSTRLNSSHQSTSRMPSSA